MPEKIRTAVEATGTAELGVGRELVGATRAEWEGAGRRSGKKQTYRRCELTVLRTGRLTRRENLTVLRTGRLTRRENLTVLHTGTR
jgi:hypothetical protein